MNNLVVRPFAGLVSMPLERATGEARLALDAVQEATLLELRGKLDARKYRLRSNHCLCANDSPEKDQVVLEQDRYGLPTNLVLCRQCSLVRTDPVLDDASLAEFYEQEFGPLHRGSREPTDNYLSYVRRAGHEIHSFISEALCTGKVERVLEIGCATGANLLPFHADGKAVLGFDYDENYLSVGVDQGMDLRYGDYQSEVPHESQDLVILSHVLEHLTTPVEALQEIVSRIAVGGHLYVEVPGVFSISRRWKHTPVLYHQNDHIFHYHSRYLRTLFESLGLEVLHCDEWCRVVVRKPQGWKAREVESISTESLKSCCPSVARELRASYLYFGLRKRLVHALDKLGVKGLGKQLRSVIVSR